MEVVMWRLALKHGSVCNKDTKFVGTRDISCRQTHSLVSASDYRGRTRERDNFDFVTSFIYHFGYAT